MALADGPSAATPKAAESPQEQLRTARAALEARGTHRERRVYGSPNPLTQVIEFAGKRQRWITEFNNDGKQSRQETIWEGGRSASRRLPDSAAWQRNPQIDDALTEPKATVSDGGCVTVEGHAAHRYIEKFTNEPARGTVTHLVDIDEKSGLPLQITSTESDGGRDPLRGDVFRYRCAHHHRLPALLTLRIPVRVICHAPQAISGVIDVRRATVSIGVRSARRAAAEPRQGDMT